MSLLNTSVGIVNRSNNVMLLLEKVKKCEVISNRQFQLGSNFFKQQNMNKDNMHTSTELKFLHDVFFVVVEQILAVTL